VARVEEVRGGDERGEDLDLRVERWRGGVKRGRGFAFFRACFRGAVAAAAAAVAVRGGLSRRGLGGGVDTGLVVSWWRWRERWKKRKAEEEGGGEQRRWK